MAKLFDVAAACYPSLYDLLLKELNGVFEDAVSAEANIDSELLAILPLLYELLQGRFAEHFFQSAALIKFKEIFVRTPSKIIKEKILTSFCPLFRCTQV